mmetsp:Transcript_9087/g.21395  ORF Transcript_9087/g.21395 Transcript_9087/m.21395 type:complete len:230 (+) Transcript_9087:111-800(+)
MADTISANSGLSEAPPTRKPSMSGWAERSGAFLALAEPPYWMRISSAVFSSTLALIQSRMALCVSCACSGEAVTPVPMAHTGSYAITTFDLSSRALRIGTMTSSCGMIDSFMSASRPFSRMGSGSPMHHTHIRPFSRMYAHLVASSASDSGGVGRPNSPRRSEWPIRQHLRPRLTIWSTAISPVKAPQPLKLQFCGATMTPSSNLSYTMPTCRLDGHTYTSHATSLQPV